MAKDNILENFSKKFKLTPKAVQLLIKRGSNTPDTIERFLHGGKKYFSDPRKIGNISSAVERIKKAIANDESVVIYGDYDADGICSVAILYLHLNKLGVNVHWYIPDRAEGYGINLEAVEKIAEDFFPDLLITCDCGIMACDEIEHITSLGIDVIVTDHHEPFKKIPDCIVVNPKLDNDNDLKNLCGAGVVLKLMQALSGIDETMEYLDIAAIATIADSVPLVGENRDIVKEGLELFNNCARPGICALAKTFNVKEEYNSATLAFMIAPRINAAGRIGAAERAIVLFIESDEHILEETAKELNDANSERQDICENILNGILNSKRFKEQLLNPVLAVYDETYPSGILGIVASKLAERFCRPVFIFTKEGEGILKGSGRSALGINLFESLSLMQDLFVKFGGHSQAAGVTLEEKNFQKFISRFNELLKDFICLEKEDDYDLELSKDELTLSLAKDLNLFEPFGVGNRRPKFLLKADICEITPMKNYINHLIVKTCGKLITSFNYSEKSEILSSSAAKNLIIEVLVNNFNNKESLKCVLKNAYINDDKFECFNLVLARYIESFLKKGLKPASYKKITDYDAYIDGNYGTLFITNDCNTFNNFNIINFEKNHFNVTHKNNNNKIILSPNFDLDFSFYNKIVLLEKPHDGYISELNGSTKAEIYIMDKNLEFNADLKNNMDFSREVFLEYYKLISQNLDNFIYLNDIKYVYNYFKNIDSHINIVQFSICYCTFLDLKLLTTNIESGKIKSNNIKVDLNSSAFLQKVKDLI